MIKIKYFSFGFVCCMALFFLIHFSLRFFEDFDTAYSIKKTHQNGVKIVEAIDIYYNKEGVYPECLAQLLTHYLSNIPPSYIDVREWYYYRTEDGFFLGASQSYPVCQYKSSTKKWDVEY